MGNETWSGKDRRQKTQRSFGGLIALIFLFTQCGTSDEKEESWRWKAPEEAERLKNPLAGNVAAEQKGKELYDVYCWSCHGPNGYGDGAAGGSLGQRPANFHDRRVKRQSDGALFWKMSNGKDNMPAFKQALTEEQRWQLVSYIRKFTIKEPVIQPPVAIRSDITVSHVMRTDSMAVRILHHPVTKHLYYTTFDGNVFRIRNLDSVPVQEKVITAAQHGINRLQGAVFLDNQLFLCGNVDLNDKKGTSGRMVRCTVDTAGAKDFVTVFTTVEYGANRTIYDHGWNALAISADKKFIYVNSGARTDHGEVQDNGGLYPNARDNSLTAKIFRFPVDAKNLVLPDLDYPLRGVGYIYADGIRNAYDMEVDGSGNLFAVVNSSDYDNPEDMFWVRKGKHYGFPWVMGGIENPQQFPTWKPDPETDPFINEFSHSWQMRYFATDTTFPKIPKGLRFSPGIQNLGPAANEYRGHSGEILDGDITGVPVSTFTPHCSPLGLMFDTEKKLGGLYNGDGFVLRYTSGSRGSMMRPFTSEGSDLLHLKLSYDSAMDNYFVKTYRLVKGFSEPVDAVLVGNDAYIIEYSGEKGNIWKISFPPAKETRSIKKDTKN